MQDHESRRRDIDDTLSSLADAVPVQEVPKLLPRQANGKRIHIATVYRWMLHGRRGIRLHSFLIGGRRYVHLRDLLDWIDRLTQEDAPPPVAVPLQTPRQRRRQQERARRRVQEILYGRK